MEQNPSKIAYEEAAKLCERKRCRNWDAYECAAQIREQLINNPRDYLKQPQPGDIVQYISSANARYKGANPPYSCGEVLGIKDGIMKVVFSQTDDEEYFGTEGVHKWRWPGEKEWRR